MHLPVNDLIKVLYKKTGNIYDFANICGASPKTVRKWLKGAKPDSVHFLNAMNYFGLIDLEKVKELHW